MMLRLKTWIRTQLRYTYPDFRRILVVFVVGACAGAGGLAVSAVGIHYTGTPEFCMICHEMRIVGEQGWMKSVHYQNARGITAECKDCHIPPELPHMLWTKVRDGSKDIYHHFLGESTPSRMDWDELRETARGKVSDSACKTCHDNLTPKGAPIKEIIAHRAYLRMDGRKRCVDCHRTEFHGAFKSYIFAGIKNGGRQ